MTAPVKAAAPTPVLRRAASAVLSGWGRAVISIVLLVPLLAHVDLVNVLAIMAGAQPWLLALALAVAVLQILLSAYRWCILVRSHHRVSFRLIRKVTFVSGFFGWFVPGGGIELLRLYDLARAAPEIGWAVTSVVVERLLGLLALAALSLGGILLSSAELPPALTIAAAACLALLLCCVPLAMATPVRRVMLGLLPGRRLEPLRRLLERCYRELDAMRSSPGMLAWVSLVTLGCQAMRIAITVVAAIAVGADVPVVHFIALMPPVILASLLPISVGGLGVREATFVSLFALVGLPADTAFATATVNLAVSVAATLPGLWWYGMDQASRRVRA